MIPTRTTIAHRADGTHTVTVRSQVLPSIYARRAKVPNAATAYALVPDLQAHVAKMVAAAREQRA